MTAIVFVEPAFQRDGRSVSHPYFDHSLVNSMSLARKEFHDVWENNFDKEFSALLRAVSRAGGSEALLGMDMEFPGFICEDPQFSSEEVHYEALRKNIDQMWPIQLGVAVVGPDGAHYGIWTFNLQFDSDTDSHTEESLAFLRRAGIDFPRHQSNGINRSIFGKRLVHSSLVGQQAPRWLTFSGSYDWGYLLKLVTFGRALPGVACTFHRALSIFCPKRQDLRDFLPEGSLEALGRQHGVARWGRAHTAGSDALLTAELFMMVANPQLVPHNSAKVDEDHQKIWGEISSYADNWYANDSDGWHTNSFQHWEGNAWEFHSHGNNDCGALVNSFPWNSYGLQSWEIGL